MANERRPNPLLEDREGDDGNVIPENTNKPNPLHADREPGVAPTRAAGASTTGDHVKGLQKRLTPKLKNLQQALTTKLEQQGWIPTWSSLNQVGKSKILRTSYFWMIVLPIVAKALSSVENDLTFQIFSAEVRVSLSLPFTWQLFYCSAVLISVANIIYVCRCPWLVSHFSDFPEYTQSGRTFRELAREYANGLRRELLRENQHVKSLLIRFLSEYGDPAGVNEDSPGDVIIKKMGHQTAPPDEKFKAGFWNARKHLEGLFVSLRLACTALYAAGLVLIFYVVLEQVFYVL